MHGSILSVVVVLVALAGCGGSDGAVAASSASEKEGASAGTQASPSQDAPTRYQLVLDRPFTEGYQFAIRVEITAKTEGSVRKGEETKPFSETKRYTVDAAAVVERVGPAGQLRKVRYTIRSMEVSSTMEVSGTAVDGTPLERLPSGTEITAEAGKALLIRVPGDKDVRGGWHGQVRPTLNGFLQIEESDQKSQERFGPPGPVAIGERWDVDGGSFLGGPNSILSPEAEFSGWAQLDDVTMVGGNGTSLVTLHLEATDVPELELFVSEVTQQYPLDPTKHSSGRTTRAEWTFGDLSVQVEEDVFMESMKQTTETKEVWEHP